MESDVVRAIAASGLSIYDPLDERPDLFIDTGQLERILNHALAGLDLHYPLRTRAKVLKSVVCEALGYPVPAAFRRCRPRFPGQRFDAYVQKSNNLQIWNEEVSASRRYVLVRVDASHVVTKVRVVTGSVIADYEKSGTLTHKYQARSRTAVTESRLVSDRDTAHVIRRLIQKGVHTRPAFLPIGALHRKLLALVGTSFRNPGTDQERNRGGVLHAAVLRQLGKLSWSDAGQFPDVPEQLLEIKLQTAPTIDLGLVCPDSTEQIADLPEFHHCDVRYAVFYATVEGARVFLNHLIMTPGADFFKFFRRFEGKVRNSKLQVHLPADFFA